MTEYRCTKCNHEIHFEHGKWHHYIRQTHWAVPPKITDRCSVCGDPIHYNKNGYNRKWFHFYKHNHPAEIQNNNSNLPPKTNCWIWKWTYINWFKFGLSILLVQFVLQNLQNINNLFSSQIPVGGILIFALGIFILKHMYGIVMWWIEYFDRYPATNLIIDVCGYLIILSVIISIPLSIQPPDASMVDSNKISIYKNDSNVKYAVSPAPTSEITTSPVETSSSENFTSSSAVLLHGEKTDVVLGEDILLKLSAVNLITKPPMSVQVMIYPPSGMSVTGSEFVKSGAGIYTTTYTLNPGDGKDIEVHIKSNQVGDFNVKGRIVYYFGEEKDKAEDHTLNLPIKVRKEPGQPAPLDSTPKTPGFPGEFAIIGILFVTLLIKRRG